MFVDSWREHVDAMKKGLKITGVRGEKLIKVNATTPEHVKEPLELLLIATKSQHTEEAVKGVQKYITPETTIASLQNGFNVYRIARNVPNGTRQVIGSVPNYTGALVDPGHLELDDVAPLHIGEMDGRITNRLRTLQKLFSNFTEIILSDNIVGEIWAKQVYGSMIVVTSLINAPIVDVLAVERNAMIAGALVKESIKVARAAGIDLRPMKGFFDPRTYSPETPEETKEYLRFIKEVLLPNWGEEKELNLVKQASGMWWDIVYRKRKSETRWIVGDVVEEAKRLGVPVPANERLVNMVYELEDGKRSMGTHNLNELEAYMKKVGCVLPT